MAPSVEQYLPQKLPPDLGNHLIERLIVAGFDGEIDTTDTTCQENERISTYLALRQRSPGIVEAVFPDTLQAARVIGRSNLDALGKTDIVILGTTECLPDLCSTPWEGADATCERDIFRVKKWKTARGKQAALVYCVERFWGQAVQHLIEALQARMGVRCVIYVAKAGSLARPYKPNRWIATGDRCVVEDRHLTWNNVLQDACKASKKVAYGSIVTVSTTLCEDHAWLGRWSSEATWVDCEVGYMAETTLSCGLDFGYLDIVSDNLHSDHEPSLPHENLSNEETIPVVTKRQDLYNEIEEILGLFVSEWDGKPPGT